MKRIDLEVPKSIKDLNQIFKKSGKKLYLVGGAVRDFVTGDVPKDFDLTTDATPDEIIELLSDKHRINLQGEKFGVIVVYGLDDLKDGVEIATFREDIGKGKDTSVKVGATIDMDVKRRDITFNGLFYDLDICEVIDLVGGLNDLDNKIVRMIGDPLERIDEDKVRILRVFRFAARYDFTIHIDTSNAIKSNNKLTDISKERIWDEFGKGFKQAKEFRTYLDLINRFEMWDEIFPGVEINTTNFIETKDITICLAQLFRDVKNIKDIMVKKFKTPLLLAETVNFLLELQDFDIKDIRVLTKKRDRLVNTSNLIEWFNILNLNDSPRHKAFIDFVPNVVSDDVMRDLGIETDSKGNPKSSIDGQRLGEEINKRTISQFTKLWNS